jgi:DNA-binding NarL/FixJ family response regulator
VVRRRTPTANERFRRGRLARLMPELRDLADAADAIPIGSVRQLIALLENLEHALLARAASAERARHAAAGCRAPLAPRPRRVLALLKAGRSEKEIAGQLGISVHTVHTHVTAVYRHYGVCSRSELLALWVPTGPPRRSGDASCLGSRLREE